MTIKEIKIGIAIPTAGRVPIGFAASLAGMVACFAANKIPTVPEAAVTVGIRVLESSNWITNREKLAAASIEAGETHLMFLDDDMVFDPRVLEILLGRRQSVVTTNYLIKTEPASKAEFVAVSLDGQRRVRTTKDSVGIEPVTYSGFGVSLIETDVFRRVVQPWFMPDFNAQKNEYTTEDNPFFRRVREAGVTVYVDHDASKMVGHVGQKTWSWKETCDG